MAHAISSAGASPASSVSVSASASGSSRPRPALRLVKTQGLSREQWLEVRRGGIGSSDAAAAVGLNPYQSQLELWMIKTGRGHLLPAVDESETSPLYWGTLLEPIVAAHYTKRTGNRVRKVNAVLQHPDHPWMLANIDREVVGCPDVQILECKTAGYHGERLWRDGVPEYVQLQVMHQLAVTGKQAADVAVLICGQELRVHRVARDEAMIRQLVELEHAFKRFVDTDTAPAADGSESSNEALRALYPRDAGQTLDLRGDLVMESVFSDLVAVRAALKAQGEREAQLKQAIVQRMGDASMVLFETGVVSFKRSKDGLALDEERLGADHPELMAQYQVPKPGSRRFLVSSNT